MKKFVAAVLAVILLAAVSFPFLKSKTEKLETDRLIVRQHQRRQKEINSLYSALCTQLTADNFSQAEELCESCLLLAEEEEYSDIYFDVLLKKAVCLNKCGEYEKSLEACRILAGLSPELPEIWLLEADNFNKLNDFNAEKNTLLKYSVLSGDRSLCGRIGDLAFNDGSFQQAVEAFNAYENGCPDRMTDETVFLRGICYMSLTDYVRAADDFKRCTENGFEPAASAFELGICLMKIGKVQEASEHFRFCMENDYRAEEASDYLELCG